MSRLSGSGCPVIVSHVLFDFSEDVCVALSFKASMLYGRWHVRWNVSDKRVRVKCKRGMVS